MLALSFSTPTRIFCLQALAVENTQDNWIQCWLTYVYYIRNVLYNAIYELINLRWFTDRKVIEKNN